MAKSKTDKRRQKAISSLNRLLENEKIRGTTREIIIKKLIARLSDNTFRIAIVGEFSSGKSTFLNALIGKDILKHGTLETTATITEIENTPHTKAEKCDIFFRDGRVVSDEPLEKLESYTAVSSKIFDVAKEIRKVVIKCHIFDSDASVVFIDTPGLNGVADKHREQTIEQIEKAHACVYLIQARGLSKSDIDFLCHEVGTYQNSFLFVQNFIDELSSLEGESLNKKLEEQEKIIKEHIKQFIPNINYKIVGVSSKEALLAKDKSITTHDSLELNDDIRRELLEKSNIVNVINILHQLVEDNIKSATQERDTYEAAINVLRNIQQSFTDRYNELNKLEHSNNNIHKINNLITRFHDNKHKNEQQLEAFIINETEVINDRCNTKINDYIVNLKNSLCEKIDDCIDFTQLSNYMDKNVKSDLNNSIKPLRDDLREIINIGFENIVALAVLRIQQYTSILDEKDIKKANFNELELDDIDYRHDENALEENKKKVAKIKKDIEDKKREIDNINAKEVMTKQEIENNQRLKKAKKSNYQRNILELGNRPAAKEWTTTETKTRERKGFWGGIANIFLGDEEYEVEVKHFDTSNQEAWDRNKARIESDFAKTNSDLKRKEYTLQNKLNEYMFSRKFLEDEIQQNRQSVDTILRLIKEKEERIRIEKEKALSEAIRNAKRQAKQQIDVYLEDGLKPSLRNVCRKQLDKSKNGNVKEYIMRIYHESCKSRLNELNHLLANNDLDSNCKSWMRSATVLGEAISILEEVRGGTVNVVKN